MNINAQYGFPPARPPRWREPVIDLERDTSVSPAALIPGLLLIGLAVAAASGAAVNASRTAEGCHWISPALRLDETISTSLTLPAGARCPVEVLRGWIRTEQAVIDRAPSHGSLTSVGQSGFIYRSNEGYRGKDSFAFSLSGAIGQKKGTMKVGVNVVVR